jgi:agmatine deiminase
MSLPAQLGYRMPAEWAPHEATWIAWPHQPKDWPGKFATVPWVYAEIVRHLIRSERVHILVDDEVGERRARLALVSVGVDLGRVRFHQVPTDRCWMRDSGPIFVKGPGGDVGLLDWGFNAWSKYDNWQRDDAVPLRLAEILGMRYWIPKAGERRVVLEGGSIDVNGAGLLLTTEECLLSDMQARNPGLGKEAIEKVLAEYLGIRKVLWLGRGIVGDDTHGHIDDIARFVGPRTIVAAVEEDPQDANYELLQENLRRLWGATDLEGEPLEVVRLPMPEPVVFRGQRLPASYANFYIANKVVLVPTFNDRHDREALDVLAGVFSDRQVIGIHAVDLVWGLGTLHCLSQQEPASGATS